MKYGIEKQKEIAQAVKRLFEEEDKTTEQISIDLKISTETVRHILKGKLYDGVGKSDKYLNLNAHKILDQNVQLAVIQDYIDGKPIPEILEEYNISRANLQYYREKFNIPERYLDRAVTLKSITLSIDGEVRTYPSVESASKSLQIPSDFLHKLKRAETFCEGKNSKKDIYLIHDLNRLVKLERSSELMGKILYGGTASEKFEWGNELKTLMFELGYAKEEDIEL